MLRLLLLLFALAACGAAPQKSLSPDLGTFASAFVETGRTDDAWSVAHIVRTDAQYALIVYVRRTDGRPAGVSHVRDASFDVQRVQVGEFGAARIAHPPDMMRDAAKTGFEATLCGPVACYPVKAPAALYQQALFE